MEEVLEISNIMKYMEVLSCEFLS